MDNARLMGAADDFIVEKDGRFMLWVGGRTDKAAEEEVGAGEFGEEGERCVMAVFDEGKALPSHVFHAVSLPFSHFTHVCVLHFFWQK